MKLYEVRAEFYFKERYPIKTRSERVKSSSVVAAIGKGFRALKRGGHLNGWREQDGREITISAVVLGDVENNGEVKKNSS